MSGNNTSRRAEPTQPQPPIFKSIPTICLDCYDTINMLVAGHGSPSDASPPRLWPSVDAGKGPQINTTKQSRYTSNTQQIDSNKIISLCSRHVRHWGLAHGHRPHVPVEPRPTSSLCELNPPSAELAGPHVLSSWPVKLLFSSIHLGIECPGTGETIPHGPDQHRSLT